MVLYGVLSLHVMAAFMVGRVFDTKYDGDILRAMDGSARRPPAYRVLLPLAAHAVLFAIPDTLEKKLASSLTPLAKMRVVKFLVGTHKGAYPPPHLTEEHIVQTTVVYLLIYVSLLAFLAMLYRLAAALMPQSPAYAWLAPAAALIALPPFTHQYAYIYDFPELFFSCACLYLLFRRRWNLYLLCLAVATLNKETTIFVVFFYCIWFWRELPREQYIILGIAQLLIFAIVKLSVTEYFSARDGLLVGYSPVLGWLFWVRYGYDTLFRAVILFVLIVWRWEDKPLFLRASLWMLLPNVAAHVITANPPEYRSLYWSLPVLVLLAVHTLVGVTGMHRWKVFSTKENRDTA